MKSRFIVWLAIASVQVLGVGAVDAARAGEGTYTIVEIPTLGGTENFAYAINDRGDVVGSSRLPGDHGTGAFLFTTRTRSLKNLNGSVPQDINRQGHIATDTNNAGIYVPALYELRGGKLTPLGSFGGVFAGEFNGTAYAVNDLGQAVGYSYRDSFTRHAFLYRDGVMSDLGSLASDPADGYSVALAINAAGDVVGLASDTPFGVAHAFVIPSGGVMEEIDPFGGPDNESYARGINDFGDVVGEALTPTFAFHAFVRVGGVPVDLGTLPTGLNSYAYAINNAGHVVGVADEAVWTECWDPEFGSVPCLTYEQRAFLFQGGVMTSLNSLLPADSGWDLSWAFDINQKGQIVGYGTKDGYFRAFVLSPATQ